MYETINEKIKALKNCYFGTFAIFGSIQCLLFFDDASIYSKLPIIAYLTFFIIAGIFILKVRTYNTTHHFMEFSIVIIIFFIYSLLNLFISPITIQSRYVYDIYSLFSIITLTYLLIGITLSKYLSIRKDFKDIPYKIQIRDSEIELKSMNFWSELSLNKALWLEKPVKALKYGMSYFIIFVGGSASGLSLAIAEGLKRSELLGSNINTHAFLFFILGVPVALASGILLYPLLSHLYRWRKLVKEINQEYGSYTVLLNLENKPYSELKQGLSER